LVVLVVLKWDINPDKVDAYLKWTGGAIKRILAVPGVTEFRAYRSIAGTRQAQVTYEFPDLATWAAWRSNEEVQRATDELYTVALNVTTEVWGPSPVVPKAIRPGK
jgi:antibiotic biosynthesis monooxygenase (ABM) superfamily enzyme